MILKVLEGLGHNEPAEVGGNIGNGVSPATRSVRKDLFIQYHRLIQEWIYFSTRTSVAITQVRLPMPRLKAVVKIIMSGRGIQEMFS